MREPRGIAVFTQGGHADGLRAVPFVRALRRHRPRAPIAVIGPGYTAELWRGCPYVDDFIATSPTGQFPPGRRGRLQKALAVLRLLPRTRGRFDLAINLAVQPEGGLFALLATLSGVARRAGYGGRRHGVNVGPGAADMRVAYEERALRLLAGLGIEDVDLGLEAWCGEGDRASARRLLGEGGWRHGRRLVVCHPGSDWNCQTWPAARWAQVADELARRGCLVALTGGAAEAGMREAITARTGVAPADLGGRTSFGELAAVLELADLVISTDTLVAPLALAMGTRVITLPAYDNSNWSQSRLAELDAIVRYDLSARRPWSVTCQWLRSGRLPSCHSGSCVGLHAMGRITVEEVLRRAEGALDLSGRPTGAVANGRGGGS